MARSTTRGPHPMQRDPLLSKAMQAQGRLDRSGRALLTMRRATLKWLRKLDRDLTGQWVGVNTGKTAAAGMGIAAAVLVFVAPPVGLGLGIGAAATGTAATIGDFIANKIHEGNFRGKLREDRRQAEEYTEHAKTLKTTIKEIATKYHVPEGDIAQIVFTMTRDITKLGVDVTRHTFSAIQLSIEMGKVGKVVVESGGRASIGVMEGAFDAAAAGRATGDGLKIGSMTAVNWFTKTLSIAGAVVQTVDAVVSWCTTTPTQASIRKAIDAMDKSVKELQIFE